jgi:hypothetical protein
VNTNKPAAFRELESHLFIIRVWSEDLGDGQSEWRAYVRHVPCGEARYVRRWSDLEIFLGQHSDLFSKRPVLNGQSTIQEDNQ